MGQTSRITVVSGTAARGIWLLPLVVSMACAADGGGTPSTSRPARPQTTGAAAVGGSSVTPPASIAGNGGGDNPPVTLLSVAGSGPNTGGGRMSGFGRTGHWLDGWVASQLALRASGHVRLGWPIQKRAV